MCVSVHSRNARAPRPGLSNAVVVPFADLSGGDSNRRTAAVSAPDRLVFPRPENYCTETAPGPVCAPASELFSEHLLQHVLVEGQVSHQRFQFLVLVFQLSQPGQLRDPHARYPPLPLIQGLFCDAHLATYFRDGRTTFCLPHGVEHLLRREVLPHPPSCCPKNRVCKA